MYKCLMGGYSNCDGTVNKDMYISVPHAKSKVRNVVTGYNLL